MTRDDLDDLARGIFRALDDLAPEGLRLVAAGPELADGRPVRWFAMPIGCYASDCERGTRDPSPLSTITMVSALPKAVDEGSTLSRLADSREAFWVDVGDAIAAVAADRLPVGSPYVSGS